MKTSRLNVFTCKDIHGKISVVDITEGNTFEHKAIKNRVLYRGPLLLT